LSGVAGAPDTVPLDHPAVAPVRLPRAVLSARGQKATPAPAEFTSPIKRARQGASAIRVRAPP